MSSNEPTARSSLRELLATWERWNSGEFVDAAWRRAEVSGDYERAATIRQWREDELALPETPSALQALAAQRELSNLMQSWSWHTVRAARESGATWQDIADSTRSDPVEERFRFVEQIERARHAAEESNIPFDDLHRYLNAVGDWTRELRSDTPDDVFYDIAPAILSDDPSDVKGLQALWWDPTRPPAGTTRPHSTASGGAGSAEGSSSSTHAVDRVNRALGASASGDRPLHGGSSTAPTGSSGDRGSERGHDAPAPHRPVAMTPPGTPGSREQRGQQR